MIPLINILPTDSLYSQVSGVITKITPTYSAFRNAIQIEFKYDLNEYFYIEIELSELHQPRRVTLYGFYKEASIDVADDINEYPLVGEKVVVIMSKDTILDIVNNVATADSIETGMEIKLKAIIDKSKPEDRPIISEIDVGDNGIVFTLDGVECSYTAGTIFTNFKPVFEYGSEEIELNAVDGNLAIYHLPNGYSFAAVFPDKISKHYIFRQNSTMKKMFIDADTINTMGATITYRNSLVSKNGAFYTMQRYLFPQEGMEYRQYLFNAARDKNLYTEVSLLFPSIVHNFMSVYDMEENDMLIGEYSYFSRQSMVSGGYVSVIMMDNCKTLYGKSVDKTFVFEFEPTKAIAIRNGTYNNISDIGNMFVVDGNDTDVLLFDETEAELYTEEFLYGANARYAVSININALKKSAKETSIHSDTASFVTHNDILPPGERFELVDYDESLVGIQNGSIRSELSFDEARKKFIVVGDSEIFTDTPPTFFGGITMNASPTRISTSDVNITNYNTIALLCRFVEDPTYGVEGVKRGTRNFAYTMSISFDIVDVMIVLNVDGDYLYVLDITNKYASKTLEGSSPAVKAVISSIDFGLVKRFLLNRSYKDYVVEKTSFPLILRSGEYPAYQLACPVSYIDDDGDFLAHYVTSEEVVTDEAIESTNGDKVIVPAFSKQNVLSKTFGQDASIMKEIATGIYASSGVDIVSCAANGDIFEIVTSSETGEDTTRISLGGHFEYKVGLSHRIPDGEESFTTIESYNIDTTIPYDSIFQHGPMIVIKSEIGVSIAVAANLIKRSIASSNIGYFGTILLSYGNKSVVVDAECSSVSVADASITIDGNTIQIDANGELMYAIRGRGSSAKAIAVISKERLDENLEEGYISRRISEGLKYENFGAKVFVLDSAAENYIQIRG